jgi:hypothetical protein
MMKRFGNALIFLLSLVVVSPVVAQNRHELLPEPEWGTSVESALVVGSFEFQPYSPGTVMATDGFFTPDRFVSTAGAQTWGVCNISSSERCADHWI